MIDWSVAAFRKGNGSGLDGCVEVARVGEVIGVRDSKNPDGPVLEFSPREAAVFRAGVLAGEFDDLLAE
jgi:hypothetical protein